MVRLSSIAVLLRLRSGQSECQARIAWRDVTNPNHLWTIYQEFSGLVTYTDSHT